MPAKRLGWNVFIGISNTTITNGLYSKECGPIDQGGDGTLVADIDVVVPELTPYADGSSPEEKKTYDVALMNPYTQQVETRSISFSSVIRCKYFGALNTNQYIPCIHKGEQVVVLQHEGGEFSYFWIPLGRDEGIRNREHVRWYAHNIPKAVDEKTHQVAVPADENTYFIDIDTNGLDPNDPSSKLKRIHIHTSKSDGEDFAYDIRIYPELAKLEICDDADGLGGNRLELDSRQSKWTLRNIFDSFIKVDKENITISCKGTINVTAGKNIEEVAGWVKTDLGATEEIAGNKGVINVRTGTHNEVGVKSTEMYSDKIVTATQSFIGKVTINGLTTVVPDAVIGGKSFNGHIHSTGTGSTSQPVR